MALSQKSVEKRQAVSAETRMDHRIQQAVSKGIAAALTPVLAGLSQGQLGQLMQPPAAAVASEVVHNQSEADELDEPAAEVAAAPVAAEEDPFEQKWDVAPRLSTAYECYSDYTKVSTADC